MGTVELPQGSPLKFRRADLAQVAMVMFPVIETFKVVEIIITTAEMSDIRFAALLQQRGDSRVRMGYGVCYQLHVLTTITQYPSGIL